MGPDTRTFGVSSMFWNYNRLRRTSQIETIYQTISNYNALVVYINTTNTATATERDTLKGVPYTRTIVCGNSAVQGTPFRASLLLRRLHGRGTPLLFHPFHHLRQIFRKEQPILHQRVRDFSRRSEIRVG